MSCSIVLGAQWGDEGKGKIVDIFTEDADVVVRSSGGHNAGHTVYIHGEKYVLHLIPSGIMHKDKINIIGNGVVVEPKELIAEMEGLKKKNITFEGRFYISKRAHLIMPYHIIIDQIREELKGNKKIGTTGRGIGPTYSDKMSRTGIRVCDLYDETVFRDKLEQNVREVNFLLETVYKKDPINAEDIFKAYMEYAEYLKPFVAETAYMINDLAKDGKKIMMEGAQGSLLDVDFGTYPFVTSSNATAGGTSTGTGLGPMAVTNIVGVMKAYTTRVGSGPFPTELFGKEGDELREAGGEYGATTGRPRRCGWLDLVAARYAVTVSGIKEIAITKLDVLSGLEKIKLCTGYKFEGKIYETFPPEITILENAEPVYTEFDGWDEDITGCKEYDELPANAKKYLHFIKDYLGIDYSVVSVGPDRVETIKINNIF